MTKTKWRVLPMNENAAGIGGALAKGETYIPSKNDSLVYFNRTNIDAALSIVKTNGGKTLYPKTAIGKLGWVAEFEDCEGNKIELHSKEA